MGLDQIPILIVKKVQETALQLIPTIIQMGTNAGIENIGLPNMKMPDSCLPSSELTKMIDLRNKLMDKLIITSQALQTLSRPINSLNTVVTTTSTAVDTLNTTRTALNVAMAAFPGGLAGTPGALPATINNLKDLIDFLNPKISLAKNNINSISTSLDFANSVLYRLITALKAIDQYLTKCAKDANLTPLNGYLTTVVDANTQVQSTPTTTEIYQGFILDVVEEVFSPTVNRRKAVAKNKDGIVLLQTPLSFTTLPQLLIAELKLIIDSSDLKAY